MASEHRQTPSILAYENLTLLKYHGAGRTFDITPISPPKLMENIAEREATCCSSLVTKSSGGYDTAPARQQSSVLLLCKVAAELRNFKTYRFFHRGTEANRSKKHAPVTALETC